MLRAMPPPTPPAVRRVLLLHPGALGDLVQALPAFGAVRAAFADAHVTLLTDAPLAALARGTGLVDAVVAFDAAVAYHGRPAARLALLARLAATVRRVRPEAVAVFKGAPVYAALALASGARRRAGLARGAGRALLSHPVAIDPTRHHEDRYLDVAAALGADPERRVAAAWPATPSPVAAAVRAGAWPLVGVAPGGARNAKQDTPTKRWPASRFAALARELAAAHPDAAFVLLGGPGDRDEVEVVRAALPADRVVDLAGRTSVHAARAAVAALDVYVGNDSGLMHLAATTDTPAVIPFGPTDPRVIAPRAPGVRAVWSPAADPPCYDEVTGAHRPCRTPCCIDRVDVARVRAAVDAALAAARPAGRGA
jgi:ADP-heptose:LPS heptosyltransferase